MNLVPVKIFFCFPELLRDNCGPRELVESILEKIRNNGSIERVGLLRDDDLRKELLRKFDGFKSAKYRPLRKKEKMLVKDAIISTVSKCFERLPHPEVPIFIFVFPWAPNDKDGKDFGGVDAVAVHESVMHLFISPDGFTPESLNETVAHEYNHLVFYHYRPAKKYTLLEQMIIEGLAEIFREEVVGGNPAVWTTIFSEKAAINFLASIRNLLYSRNRIVHRAVLYGNKKYKRWSGYSVGYRLVEKFRKKNSKILWEGILKVEPESFLPI